MPKSRNRKTQKKKAQNRTKQIEARRHKEMTEYLNKLKEAQEEGKGVEAPPYNPNQMRNPYNLG